MKEPHLNQYFLQYLFFEWQHQIVRKFDFQLGIQYQTLMNRKQIDKRVFSYNLLLLIYIFPQQHFLLYIKGVSKLKSFVVFAIILTQVYILFNKIIE